MAANMPRVLPVWLVLACQTAMLMVVATVVLLLLPYRVVSKVKQLRRLRAKLFRTLRRILELSAQGPFFRLFVYLGRKLSLGRLSSRCRPPHTVRAKAATSNEASVSFSPAKPFNPFHEESYVLSYSLAESGKDSSNVTWLERQLDPHNDCEDVSTGDSKGSRLRAILDRLPEHRSVRVRVCAANIWGRGPWSDEVSVTTLANPTDDGGFSGPLAAAAIEGAGLDRTRYWWSQNKTEVSVRIPVPGDLKSKDIRFKVTASRLEVRFVQAASGDPVDLLVGPWPKRIKADDTTWFIEESEKEGRHIAVQLVKAEVMEKWPCLIEADGHPQIDTGLLRFFTNGLGTGGIDIFD